MPFFSWCTLNFYCCSVALLQLSSLRINPTSCLSCRFQLISLPMANFIGFEKEAKFFFFFCFPLAILFHLVAFPAPGYPVFTLRRLRWLGSLASSWGGSGSVRGNDKIPSGETLSTPVVVAVLAAAAGRGAAAARPPSALPNPEKPLCRQGQVKRVRWYESWMGRRVASTELEFPLQGDFHRFVFPPFVGGKGRRRRLLHSPAFSVSLPFSWSHFLSSSFRDSLLSSLSFNKWWSPTPPPPYTNSCIYVWIQMRRGKLFIALYDVLIFMPCQRR